MLAPTYQRRRKHSSHIVSSLVGSTYLQSRACRAAFAETRLVTVRYLKRYRKLLGVVIRHILLMLAHRDDSRMTGYTKFFREDKYRALIETMYQ
jgi:hypothetical protein